VLLEITARHGHSLTNGHVARVAAETGADLLFGTDAHGPDGIVGKELRQRILLGAISFPNPRAMSLQVRSIPRAIELAKMLRPALDTALPLVRVRLVNRWFHPDEHTGELDELDRHLDRDVTVIDWEKNAADLERATAGCRTPEEYQRRAAEYRAKQPDIPMVEDLPMHPEDENDRMSDLASTLHFRFARAARRWNGEDVTLNQVIDDFVRDHFAKPR